MSIQRRRKEENESLDQDVEVDGLMDSGSGNSELLRVIEYDIRSSCAHEPPTRYVVDSGGHKHNIDRLVAVSTSKAAPVHTAAANPSCWSLTTLKTRCTWSAIEREAKEMFLPAGYPESVSEDYLEFQMWDTLQAMCSYLRGVLATQSVLESVGVGDDKKTPLAAALQWVLSDGSGMIGGLVFAYIVGPKFDANVKRWRLFADVSNDIGLTLDMLAPFFRKYVTVVLCMSSICKTMCGVAAGSTRSSLMAHFAKRDNMADCSAKENSQETAVRLMGLLFGMYFANVVNSSRASIWMAFIMLTLLHVYANYKAVSGLCIPTVNRRRALILIQRYQKSRDSAVNRSFAVRSVNQKEPIFTDPLFPIHNIHMGARLSDAVSTSSELDMLCRLYRDENFLLTFDRRAQEHHIFVVFKSDSQPQDELRGYFQAILLLQQLRQRGVAHTKSIQDASRNGPGSKQELLQSCLNQMQQEFSFFFQKLQSNGWKTHLFLLGTSQLRVRMPQEME